MNIESAKAIKTCSRRQFISATVAASAGAAVSARAGDSSPPRVFFGSKGRMPMGRIGKLNVSRLISGGNLISGWAHSRDLHYVPSLMRAYNTPEKVMDTLQLLEEHGVNTIIADPIKKPKEIFARYWKERGGKIQWIAEGHPDIDDWKTNMRESIDFGAAAVYIQVSSLTNSSTRAAPSCLPSASSSSNPTACPQASARINWTSLWRRKRASTVRSST